MRLQFAEFLMTLREVKFAVKKNAPRRLYG